MRLPDSIKKAADAFTELPSIGPRQAIRLVFHLIGRGQNNVRNLSAALEELKKIKICERCFFIHQNAGPLCDICSNTARRHDIIMVLEKETDLLSIENTGKFGGRYLILGGISKTGLFEDWQKLRLQNLKTFIEKTLGGQAEEIILGFNPTSFGDFGASLVEKELRPLTKKITRLGRGLPTGGEIEFADDDTLGAALEKRN
jgi:recombination protein RecR